MISEYLKNIDIFSQSFQFNTGKLRDRKRTLLGTFLTVAIMAATLYYFIYLFIKYVDNQIDPKFRVQSFVSNDLISIPLSKELIAFQFIEPRSGMSIDEIQAKSNQTYIVTIANYLYTDTNQYYTVPLNVVPCNHTHLQGYRCVDMSSVPQNYSLVVDTNNRAQSKISIQAYRCQDQDRYKKFVPDNCASESDINGFVNKLGNKLNIKMISSQYNITAKNFEDSYKTFYLLISQSQVMYTEFKTQNQITFVKDGYIFQNEQTYSAPISYTPVSQTVDADIVLKQAGLKYFMEFFMTVEETVFYTQIQYPTFPEILALCSSTLSLLMCLGFFGRQMAQKLIREELFLLILQNFYQSTYEKILKANKFVKQNENLDIKKTNFLSESVELQENSNPVIVPNLKTNSRQNQFTQIENDQKEKDNVLEDISVSEGQSPVIIPELSAKSSSLNVKQFLFTKNNQGDQKFGQDSIYSTQINNQKQQEDIEDSTINRGLINKNQEFRLMNINPGYDEDKQILKINQKQLISPDSKTHSGLSTKQTINKNLFERRQTNPIISQAAIASCQRSENNLKLDNSSSKIKQNKLNLPNITSIQRNEEDTNFDNQPSQESGLEKKIKCLNDQSLFKKVEESLFKYSPHFKYIFNQQNCLNEIRLNFDKLISFLSIFQKREHLQKKGLDLDTIYSIQKQVNRSLDFSQVYQEILICKKAIMMILSKEQFAALRLVGFSETFSKQISKSFNDFKDQKMSHFEEQFSIQLQEQGQTKYINNFIQRCSLNQNISELDKRIYSSIS